MLRGNRGSSAKRPQYRLRGSLSFRCELFSTADAWAPTLAFDKEKRKPRRKRERARERERDRETERQRERDPVRVRMRPPVSKDQLQNMAYEIEVWCSRPDNDSFSLDMMRWV